jgi:hypothetical protein
MDAELKSRLKTDLDIVLWSLVGAVIITFFYLSTYLWEYSIVPLRDAGAMFFGPMFCGIIVGIIIKESDMPAITYSTIIMTFFALLFIFVVLISPSFLGIPPFPIFTFMNGPRIMALSAIFIFTLTLIGMVIGKALGETVFLTVEERKELKEVREETRKWHEQLKKK